MKDFLIDILKIWIGVNIYKNSMREPKSRVGRVSNMKQQEIINNGGQ